MNYITQKKDYFMEDKVLKEFLDKLKGFQEKNKEIINKTCGLTQSKLLEDLKEAAKYKKGYYKNDNGVYVYIKGIEVTNDLINLRRMGFNGEDRGVWIHYCIVEDKSVTYIDTPINLFTANYFSKQYCKPKELMHPTTKEDFDNKVKSTVETLCASYREAIDPEEYYNAIKEWQELFVEFLTLNSKKQ